MGTKNDEAGESVYVSVRINIVNDISDLVDHFIKSIGVLVSDDCVPNFNGDARQKRMDIVSLYIFSTFLVEAQMNFLGGEIFGGNFENELNKFKCVDIKTGKDVRGIIKKLKFIAQKLSISWSDDDEPLSTIIDLVDFRNQFAHGKPDYKRIEVESGIDDQCHELFKLLKSDWEKHINNEFLIKVIQNVKFVWRSLCREAKIKEWRTMTSASM